MLHYHYQLFVFSVPFLLSLLVLSPNVYTLSLRFRALIAQTYQFLFCNVDGNVIHDSHLNVFFVG